jgi:hypothetical protein
MTLPDRVSCRERLETPSASLALEDRRLERWLGPLDPTALGSVSRAILERVLI